VGDYERTEDLIRGWFGGVEEVADHRWIGHCQVVVAFLLRGGCCYYCIIVVVVIVVTALGGEDVSVVFAVDNVDGEKKKERRSEGPSALMPVVLKLVANVTAFLLGECGAPKREHLTHAFCFGSRCRSSLTRLANERKNRRGGGTRFLQEALEFTDESALRFHRL
jgi:hypothetical protein